MNRTRRSLPFELGRSMIVVVARYNPDLGLAKPPPSVFSYQKKSKSLLAHLMTCIVIW
jgi:hypothetical protein